MNSDKKHIIVRPAKKDDMEVVRALIKEIMVYHQSLNEPPFSVQDLIQDIFEDENPWYFCLVAEHLIEKKIIGYTIYYRGFTVMGRTIFLEHIYVQNEYRNCAVGRMLIKQVAKQALQWNCVRLKFEMMSWNPAKSFYERLGAVNLTEKKKIHCYHILNLENIERIANLEI